MNQNYAKALTFDCDAFSEIKNNLNFVLQRLISNMVGTGANDGQLTLKLDVSFCKNTIENYDAEIDAPEREICLPQFKHKITSNIKINDERTGDERNDTMELFFNAETGQYEMRPIANTAQRSMFDDDMADAGFRDVTPEALPEHTDDYQYENGQ